MKEVTKDTIIADIMTIDRDLAPIFYEAGMHCLGCSIAHGETVSQACAAHGIDENVLLDRINTFLKNKEK